MLSPEYISKDKIVLYKAFIPKEGERLQLNVSEDTFGTNRNSAVAEFIKNYIRELQNENLTADQLAEKIEELRGKNFKFIEIIVKKEVFANVKYRDYFTQDRNVIVTSLNMYPYTGMRVSEGTLSDFQYEETTSGVYNIHNIKLDVNNAK